MSSSEANLEINTDFLNGITTKFLKKACEFLTGGI